MKLKSSCIILLSINSLSVNAEVTLDGTLGRGGALPGPNYLIGADLGRHQGGNLFHSFQDFNLQSHEKAIFSGPNSVSNIISRITGGNPSNIDGLIRSTIPNADMYFMNPYGIMFGPNARLDVQGSFHASTADYLRLGEGGRFDARNPSNSLLTIAPIESFGFLNSQIAPISVQGHGEVTRYWENQSTGLSVREGKTLSLIGGQIDIWMSTYFKTMTIDEEGNESPEITRLPTLSAPYGRINLASVASIGEVKLGRYFVDVSSFSNLADIHLTEKSPIRTSGEGGGSIFIRSGQFFADDSAIEAKTLGSKDGGVIDIRAGVISLTNGATLNGNTEGTGKGSSIYVQATESITVAGEHNDFPDNIDKLQRSGIYARSGIYKELTDDNLGDASKIDLEAKNILFKDGAVISVSTYGGGKGGDITLKASESVSIVGEASNKVGTVIAATTSSESDGAGDAGSLLIEAQNISFNSGAYIDSSTFGKGKGGRVTLKASDTIVFEGESSKGSRSHVSLNTYDEDEGAGDGGTLLIEANNISLIGGAKISSTTLGKGNAGTVTLHANNRLKLTGVHKNGNGSLISVYSSSSTGGNAGDIFVKAQDVLLTDGAYLISTSFGSGNAGNVHVHATGRITVAGTNTKGWPSGIFVSAKPNKEGIKGGDGGSIRLEGSELIVKDGGRVDASTTTLGAKNSQSGQAGDIIIQMTGSVTLSGVNPYGENEDGFAAGIYLRSLGNAGKAGTLLLKANSLLITDGAIIASTTSSREEGGSLNIQVDNNVSISGNSDHLALKEPATSQLDFLNQFPQTQEKISTSGIYARSEGKNDQAGQGGNITLTAQNLTLTHKGKISASSAGGGDAGQIVVKVDKLQLANDSQITTASISSGAKGNAGLIKITASDIFLNSGYISSDTSGKGSAGEVWVTAKNNITLEEGGYIASGTLGEPPDNIGNANKVVIRANELFVTTLAGIYSETRNKGNAGQISIEVNNLLIDKGGEIYTSTEGTGNAGHIEIHATDTITVTGADTDADTDIANASKIESASEPTDTDIGGQGGNITLTAQNLTLSDTGEISASSAAGGDAGQIVINVDKLQLANNSGITTAASKSGGGSIEINAKGVIFLFKEDQITTSVHKGAGNGGNLTISEPQFIVVNNGELIAQANEGDGGNINMKSNHFWVSSDSIISASSKKGLDGRVNVDSPDMNMDLEIVVVLPDGFLRNNQLQSPCASRIAENQNYFYIVPSEGTSNAVDDLLPSGPSLSQIKPIKTTKSMKGTMAKQAVKIAFLTGCQADLSEPPARVRKTVTRKRRAVKRSRVIPEPQLF